MRYFWLLDKIRDIQFIKKEEVFEKIMHEQIEKPINQIIFI